MYLQPPTLTKSAHPNSEIHQLSQTFDTKTKMKVSYLYFLLSASWLSSVLAGEAKGNRMTSFRNLEVHALDKKAAADGTEVASTETRTQNHEYASSDFEYISSLPSKKSKKGSKKGKGGSKSSKKGRTASGSNVSGKYHSMRALESAFRESLLIF